MLMHVMREYAKKRKVIAIFRKTLLKLNLLFTQLLEFQQVLPETEECMQNYFYAHVCL